MKFIENNEFSYPVGVLDNGILPKVEIFFLHYRSADEARIKWESRKKRIHYDNIYIIAKDGMLDENEILRLEEIKCNNLVVFTSKNYSKCKSVFPISKYSGMDEVGPYLDDINDINVSFIEYEYDFATFLNANH